MNSPNIESGLPQAFEWNAAAIGKRVPFVAAGQKLTTFEVCWAMLLLGIITSCLWIAVGVIVGWHRSKNAYQIEFTKLAGSSEADPSWAKRDPRWRAFAVFLGWAVAGLVGAILWFLLYVFLIVGHAEVESRSKSSSRKKSNGGLLSLFLLGGLLIITEETLRSIEEKMDDFVIKLAILITILTVLGAILAIG